MKGMGWLFRVMFVLVLIGTGVVTVAGAGVFWYFSQGLPQIITVGDYRPSGVTRVVLKGRGTHLPPQAPTLETVAGEFYKERRYLVPYEKVPESVIQAFISAEDDRFFEHQGINLASIIRAGIANFRAGHVVQGGSTITQQVAKSLLLTPERSFSRKIKEVILASRIEKNLSKQQILFLYLNQIYLGRGSYGIQAASRTYYQKDVSELTIAEAALLAGMPQAPGKYSPHLNPKRAKERQVYVLRRMYENGFITQEQMREATNQGVRIYSDDDVNKRVAPYLVEHIRRYVLEKYGETALYEGGMTIEVPTSAEIVNAAHKSLRDGLRAVDRRVGYRGPLKKLKNMAEIEKQLKEIRTEILQKSLRYEVFMPEGVLDLAAGLEASGITEEWQILKAEETYPAVVTSVDDKNKSAGVMLGAIRAELPLEHMKWARPVRDDKNSARPEPAFPSRVVSKGDVILVRPVKADKDGVIVALDQEPAVQGALFSLEAKTGLVLAMEGGYEFEQSEFNRAIQAQRQPGSAFKPIIYAAALERGFTPASVILDSPIIYRDGEQLGTWKPSNFEEKFYGDTIFRQALIKSRNVPTIKIVQKIQVPFLIDYSKRIGIDSQFNADLSIALGSSATSLMDLTQVYALFPRLGRKVTPIFYSKVIDRDGVVLEEKTPEPLPSTIRIPPVTARETPVAAAAEPLPGEPIKQEEVPQITLPTYPPEGDPGLVMDPRIAFVMSHLMTEVVNYGTGTEAKNLARIAAGKTGTTNDYLDAWFMGFTPQVVTGVWVGYDNLRSLGPGETGAKAALPIWLSYMHEAVKPYPADDFVVPPGITFASIDPVTGKLAPPNSSRSIREAFIAGTEPTQMVGVSTGTTESQGEFLKEDIE